MKRSDYINYLVEANLRLTRSSIESLANGILYPPEVKSRIKVYSYACKALDTDGDPEAYNECMLTTAKMALSYVEAAPPDEQGLAAQSIEFLTNYIANAENEMKNTQSSISQQL